jgi:hypothetical protein
MEDTFIPFRSMRRPPLLACSILAMALVALACHGPLMRSAGAESNERPLVPAVPPDSLPPDLTDSTKWVTGGSYYSGTILRDILIVRFRQGTSQAERQAAVDLVNGTVVGGRRFSKADGLYLVRVPTDGTIEPLFEAIAALEALPQVSTAMPDEILFFDTRG